MGGEKHTSDVGADLSPILDALNKIDNKLDEVAGTAKKGFKIKSDDTEIQSTNKNLDILSQKLNNIKKSKTLQKYFTDAGKAQENLTKAYERYQDKIKSGNEKQKRQATADVARYANAFTALGGNTDVVDKKIKQITSKYMKANNPSTGWLYGVENFKEAFTIMQQIEKLAPGTFFKQLSTEAEKASETVRDSTKKAADAVKNNNIAKNIFDSKEGEQEANKLIASLDRIWGRIISGKNDISAKEAIDFVSAFQQLNYYLDQTPRKLEDIRASMVEYGAALANIYDYMPENQRAELTDFMMTSSGEVDQKAMLGIAIEYWQDIAKSIEQAADAKKDFYSNQFIEIPNLTEEQQIYRSIVKQLHEYYDLKKKIANGNMAIVSKDTDGRPIKVDSRDVRKGKDGNYHSTQAGLKRLLTDYDLLMSKEDASEETKNYLIDRIAAYTNALDETVDAEKLFGKTHEDLFTEVALRIRSAEEAMDAYTKSISLKRTLGLGTASLGANVVSPKDFKGIEEVLSSGGVEGALKYLVETMGMKLPAAARESASALDDEVSSEKKAGDAAEASANSDDKATESKKEKAKATEESAKASEKEANAEKEAAKKREEAQKTSKHNAELLKKQFDEARERVYQNEIHNPNGAVTTTDYIDYFRTRTTKTSYDKNGELQILESTKENYVALERQIQNNDKAIVKLTKDMILNASIGADKSSWQNRIDALKEYNRVLLEIRNNNWVGSDDYRPRDFHANVFDTERLKAQEKDWEEIIAAAQKRLKTFTESVDSISKDSLMPGLKSDIEVLRQDIVKLAGTPIDFKNANIDVVSQQVEAFLKTLVKLESRLNTVKSQSTQGSFISADIKDIQALDNNIMTFLDNNTAAGKKSKEALEAVHNELRRIIDTGEQISKVDFDKLTASVHETEAEVRRLHQTGNSFFRSFVKQLKSANAQFFATYFSLQDMIRYVRELATTVTEVDSALTELRKVSDASTERLTQSFETSAETAMELGSSITHVINVTADWARLGYDVDAAEELARVTTLFTTVGDNMSADDASSYLISTLQGYQMAADEAEDIVDKYNQVANNFAIDTRGIGEALQRSAASFNSANTDLSKSIALITATNEVIQNPESVGTLWKTMSARIRGAKTELEELGEEEDAFTQTTSKLRDLVKSLTGFDIMKNENEYKDIYEIILGIGEAWESLSDIEQASLGEALAGKRNANALFAVLGNLDTLQDAYKAAEKSAGSAAREQENYARSIQYSLDRWQAAVEKISVDLLNSNFLKNLVESGVSLLDVLDQIVAKTNGLTSIIAGIGTGFGFMKVGGIDAISSSLREVHDNYNELSASITKYNTVAAKAAATGKTNIAQYIKADNVMGNYIRSLNGASGSMSGYIKYLISAKAKTIALNVATSALNTVITMGISLAVTGAVSLLSKLVNAEREARESAAELAEEYERESQSLDEQIEQYEKLSAKLSEAKSKGEDTYAIKEQLLDLQGELNSKYGDEYEKLNLVNGAYSDQIAILKELSEEKAIDYLSTNADKFEDAFEYLDRIRTYNLGELITNSDAQGIIPILEKYGINTNDNGEGYFNIQLSATIEDADKTMSDLYADLKAYEKTHKIDLSFITDAISSQKQGIDKDETFKQYKALRESYINATIAADDALSAQYEKGITAVEDYNKALESGEGVEAAKQNLDAIKKEISNTTFDSDGIKNKFLGIFDGVDQELEKRNVIDRAFEDKNNDLMKYAEQLRGLTDIDLSNLSDSKTKGAFNYLLRSLGLTEQNAGLLIEKLVELGIVQSGVAKSANEAASAEAVWASERDAALDKLGLRKETSSGVEYDESWTNYLETIKQLNPELADNQEELEKCALANMQFSKAVDDLSKNFKTYKESLKDATGLTPEFSDAITALADDLTYLTGINFSIEDASDFLSEAENLELLEKAINGSDEALQKLQEHASETIKFKVDPTAVEELRTVVENALSELTDDHEIDLNLNTEVFDAEIQNFATWLNENSDMGQVDVYAMLDSSPFMRNLGELMSESSAVATAVKKMFSDLGWDVDWDTIKVPTPNGSHITSTYAKDAYGNQIGQSYVKWDSVDVPTNIRYVPKSTRTGKLSTSKYTPKSFSPAQKSAAKANIDKANGGGDKDKQDDYKEFIDYFERLIKTLDNSIDLLEAHLEDVVGSFAKNTLLDAQEDLIKKKMDGYASAIDMYSEKASEALSKIPTDIAEKLQSGAVSIDEFVGEGNKEVVDAIGDYEQWADKVADCKQQLVELREAIRQLELQKFNNIVEDFTNQFDIRQSNGIDLIQKQMDLLESAGQLLGESFYARSMEQEQKLINTLQQEKEALVKQMNEALSRGIRSGDDEWIEMVSKLQEVDAAILDAKKSLEEFDNALLELHTEVFNRIQNQFSAFNNELSNMVGLFDDAKVATVDNKWTEEGLAQLGLLSQQYELAEYRIRQYGSEIEELGRLYLEGRYSATEYADKLIELKEAQWDATNAAEAAKDAILDLNNARVDIVIEGINEQIDAYSKLIEKQKEALSAEKDLHDYRKQIADENKAIVDIQRQLSAIADDDSASARARRAKLQEQLAEAQNALAETEYDHSISAQQDALDKQLEQYKETRQAEIDALNESLLNIEQILADSFEAVRANSQLIGETILATAQEHGIEMSRVLTDAWFQGENAIAHYGEVLSAETSNFIGQIQGVEYKVYELQNQANITSEGLANMFATRADNLVDELVRSYTSEANLDAMTNALHNSLSNTIDGSYSGNSAVSALNSIADAANGVAEAANNAANALRSMADAKPTEETQKYTIVDSEGNLQGFNTTTKSDLERRGFKVVGNKAYAGFATGIQRVSKNQLAWTQENGPEMIISPSSGAILTPLQKGDAVLPTTQTANIWEWSKFNPTDFAKQLIQSMPGNGGNVQTNTMQVGSLVTINGPVNDTVEMVKIASTTAATKIKQSFNELSNGLNK